MGRDAVDGAAGTGSAETDREIADQLHIGIRTVNTHVSTILRKLGVDRRRQAAAWARANVRL